MNFSAWMSELVEARRTPVEVPVRPKKHKIAAVAHSDIDRWLKSVDGLAKDLKDLQGAKKKAQDKMSQIGQKYKPDDAEKPDEKEKEKDDKQRNERKPTEQPRPQADREVLRPRTGKEVDQPERPTRRPARPADDREDRGDSAPAVKRSRIKPKPRPAEEDADDEGDE